MAYEKNSWSTIRGQANPKGFADAIRSPPLSGANLEPIGKPEILNSMKARLQFPSCLAASKPGARPRTVANGIRSTEWQHAAPNQVASSCARCLMSGHTRVNCRRPIRCRACFGWGHIATFCRAPDRFTPKQNPVFQLQQSSGAKAKVPVMNAHGLFTSLNNLRPSASEPLVFRSFGDLLRSAALFPSWAPGIASPPTTVLWPRNLSRPAHHRPTSNSDPYIEAPDLATWSLFDPSPSCRTTPSATPSAAAVVPENPPPPLCSSSPSSLNQPIVANDMAFQRADPAPFIPEGL